MLFKLSHLTSRAATAENTTAEAGKGGIRNKGRKGAPCIWPFKKGEKHVLLDVEGSGIVRHIWCTLPPGNIGHMRNVIIRMYWDGQTWPSVEVPIGDFFGIAHGRQKNLLSECVAMQMGKGLNCWIPMPFRERALITIENDSDQDVEMLFYQIDFTLGDQFDEDTGYFHAQFRRLNPCPLQEDYTILDGIQGRGVYLGTVLGVRSIFRDGWWGEGEVKFFIDEDDEYPTICGTGTEDYMGSAWGLEEVVTPYQGAPLVDHANSLFSLYRFHVKDPIYFQSKLKVTVQQIGYGSAEKASAFYEEQFIRYRAAGASADDSNCYFERSDDYCSVAYWYQNLPTAPFPLLPDRMSRSANLADISEQDRIKRTDI